MGDLWNLDGSGQSLRRDPDQHAAQPLKTGVWRKKSGLSKTHGGYHWDSTQQNLRKMVI